MTVFLVVDVECKVNLSINLLRRIMHATITEQEIVIFCSAMQRRDVSCRYPNNTQALSRLCEEKHKPSAKQECYNEKCKGTWKVGEWSEVSFSTYKSTSDLKFLPKLDGRIFGLTPVYSMCILYYFL